MYRNKRNNRTSIADVNYIILVFILRLQRHLIFTFFQDQRIRIQPNLSTLTNISTLDFIIANVVTAIITQTNQVIIIENSCIVISFYLWLLYSIVKEYNFHRDRVAIFKILKAIRSYVSHVSLVRYMTKAILQKH